MIDRISHIRCFLAVARLGSFARASIELHISQPALTVQVQQLESAVGVRLLDRNRRRVSVTQAGQDILVSLERILVEVEGVTNAGHDLATLRRGVVTVAAVPSVAATLLPPALGEFSKSYPGIRIRFRDDVAMNFVDLVSSGEVDLGIGGEIREDRAVSIQHLFTERICVFAPRHHPLSRKRVVTLRQVTQYPAIVPERNTTVRLIIEQALEQQQISMRIAHEMRHTSTAMGMVNAGLGIAILPLPSRDIYPATHVCCIAIREPVLERKIVIATKVGRALSPAVEKLIEILHVTARRFPLRHRKTDRRA
jgi:LysR family transcriptional regulator, carnitine catabolism transcriptional activator